MHSLNLRRKFPRSEEDALTWDAFQHPSFSHGTWVAVAVGGSAVLGAGASLYGANKQSKAISSANDANLRAQAEQNKNAWANYLMTRGLNPAGAQTGTIPTNPQAINARLPLWANASFARPGGATRWVKRGTAGVASAPSSNLLADRITGTGRMATPVSAPSYIPTPRQ